MMLTSNIYRYLSIPAGIILVFLFRIVPGACFILALAAIFTLGIKFLAKENSRFLITIFISALAIRLICATAMYLFSLHSGYGGFLGGDESVYFKRGMNIAAAGNVDSVNLFSNTPELGDKGFAVNLVSVMESILIFTFGPSLLLVKYCNAIIGAALPVMVFLLSKTIYNNAKLAKAASMLSAFFPSLIMWSIMATKETLTMMTVLTIFYLHIKKLTPLSPVIHDGVVNRHIRGDSKGIASPRNKRYNASKNYHDRHETTETVLTGAKSPAIHGGEYLLNKSNVLYFVSVLILIIFLLTFQHFPAFIFIVVYILWIVYYNVKKFIRRGTIFIICIWTGIMICLTQQDKIGKILYDISLHQVGQFLAGSENSSRFELYPYKSKGPFFNMYEHIVIPESVFNNMTIHDSTSVIKNNIIEIKWTNYFYSYVKGLGYTLFSPFPWDIRSSLRLIIYPQIIFWWCIMPYILYGIIWSLRFKSKETGLLIFFITCIYSIMALTEGNIGSVFRHRDWVTPFGLMFAALGFICIFVPGSTKELINITHSSK